MLALALPLVACQAAPATTAAASAECGGTDEQTAAGFYPELEALLPGEIAGEPVTALTSGRYCSERTLGSLVEAGIRELRFAGARAPSTSDRSGVSIAVFRAPGLTLDALADSFARGADSTRRITAVETSAQEVAGRNGVRIDALAGGEPRTVVLWPADTPETFNAVIAAGVDEAQIQAAVSAFRDR